MEQNLFYSHLGHENLKRNINSLYKSEEDLIIESIEKSEQADQLLKGRAALPIGTRKKYGDKEYVKTAQGWKANKDVKDAHDKIHGSKEEDGKSDANISINPDYKYQNSAKKSLGDIMSGSSEKRKAILQAAVSGDRKRFDSIIDGLEGNKDIRFVDSMLSTLGIIEEKDTLKNKPFGDSVNLLYKKIGEMFKGGDKKD
jgi:hypothetical protein